MEQMKDDMDEREKEFQEQKKQLIKIRLSNNATMIKCEQMIKSSKSLIEFVTTSEIYRKKFSE